ncbi:MAG: hypothetical protein GC190_07390 [Alphaproteobacteria bacterium]|nr:hypothetical protein [Alphaproteobacteria bacterium]
MRLKNTLFAGAAVLGFAIPISAGTALADDSYWCNGERCYDDQADETRALNLQALEQAKRENEDGGHGYSDRRPYYGADGPSYENDGGAYRARDSDGDDDTGNDDADMNPYGDQDDDND